MSASPNRLFSRRRHAIDLQQHLSAACPLHHTQWRERRLDCSRTNECLAACFLLFICFFVSEACLQAVIYASPVFLHLTSCPGGLAVCQTVVLMVYCQLNFTLKKNSPSAKVGSQDARHFLFLEKKNNTRYGDSVGAKIFPEFLPEASDFKTQD